MGSQKEDSSHEDTSRLFRSQKYKRSILNNVPVPTGMSEITLRKKLKQESDQKDSPLLAALASRFMSQEADQGPPRRVRLIKAKRNTLDKLSVLWKFANDANIDDIKDPLHLTMVRATNPTKEELEEEKKRQQNYMSDLKKSQVPEFGEGSIYRSEDYRQRKRTFYERKYRPEFLLEDTAGREYAGKPDAVADQSAYVALLLTENMEYEVIPIDYVIKFAAKPVSSTVFTSAAQTPDRFSIKKEGGLSSAMRKGLLQLEREASKTSDWRAFCMLNETSSGPGFGKYMDAGDAFGGSGTAHARTTSSSTAAAAAASGGSGAKRSRKQQQMDSEDEQDPDIKPDFSDDDEAAELLDSEDERKARSKSIKGSRAGDHSDFWDAGSDNEDDELDEDGKAILKLLKEEERKEDDDLANKKASQGDRSSENDDDADTDDNGNVKDGSAKSASKKSVGSTSASSINSHAPVSIDERAVCEAIHRKRHTIQELTNTFRNLLCNQEQNEKYSSIVKRVSYIHGHTETLILYPQFVQKYNL